MHRFPSQPIIDYLAALLLEWRCRTKLSVSLSHGGVAALDERVREAGLSSRPASGSTRMKGPEAAGRYEQVFSGPTTASIPAGRTVRPRLQPLTAGIPLGSHPRDVRLLRGTVADGG